MSGFACVKCGRRLPYAEGNALASGLACRACTPQPQTTDDERRAAQDPSDGAKRRWTAWLVMDLIANVLRLLAGR